MTIPAPTTAPTPGGPAPTTITPTDAISIAQDPGYTIRLAISPEDVADTTTLFREFVAFLDVDLTFQNIEDELAALPRKYGPPGGALLLARSTKTNGALGCIGMRQLDQHTAELKRLWVAPAVRNMGVGKALVVEALRLAREMGYTLMKLDSFHTLTAAVRMYEKMGFVPTAAYNYNPDERIVYYELKL